MAIGIRVVIFSIFFMLALVSLPGKVFAKNVVVMINLNYSVKELEAVQKAAKARGQEVIVIPPETDIPFGNEINNQRKKLVDDIAKKSPEMPRKQIEKIVEKVQLNGAKELLPEWQKELAPQAEALAIDSKKLFSLEKERGSVTKQLLKLDSELKTAANELHTLVISGHSNGEKLFGESTYALNHKDLLEIKKRTSLLPQIQHLLLLGCYTTTPMERNRWKTNFTPNLSLMAGFLGQSPSRYRKVGWDYIEQVMAKAQELDEALEAKQNAVTTDIVQRTFTSLSSFQNTSSPNLDYCGIVVSKKDFKESCKVQWELFRNKSIRIGKEYFDLTNPTKEPPTDTSNSELREYYNMVQELCVLDSENYWPKEETLRLKKLRTKIRDNAFYLIHWWALQENYRRAHQKDIDALSAKLNEIKLPAKLPSLDGNTSRKDFLSGVQSIQNSIILAYKSGKISAESSKAALAALHSAYYDLMTLSHKIPPNWIEANTAH